MKFLLKLVVFTGAILVLPIIVQAAPTYVTPSTAASFDVTFAVGAGNGVTAEFDAGTESDRLLIIHVLWNGSSAHALGDTSVTYDGIALTPFGATVNEQNSANRLYYLTAPASGTNTISVDPTDGAGGSVLAVISAYVYEGVDQSAPFDGYITSTGVDTTAELTVTSASGDTPFFAAGWRMTGHTAVTPSNYTERVDNVNSNMITGGGEGSGAASVDFTGTVTGGFAINGWVSMGANLNTSVSEVLRQAFVRFYNSLFVIRSGFIRIGR